MAVSVDFSQVYRLRTKMYKVLPGFRSKMLEVDQRAIMMLLQFVREGAPVDTGQHRSTIHIEGRSVKSAQPYAARLEYGYFGTDSLGRTYSNPAQPHFRPALYRMAPIYKAMVAAIPGQVWNSS